MATKSKGGLVPILLVGAVAVVLGPKLVPGFPDLLGDLGGQPATEYSVAPGAKPKTDKCTTDQLLSDRKCEELKVVLIDAAKMPFIAQNIIAAWAEGKPFIMHKDAPGTDDAKRSVVCGTSVFTKKFPDGSCDEFVFASTVEGGKWANVRTQEVPLREQRCQGGTLRQEYRRAGIAEGDAFMVIITNPDKVATTPYVGVDIAKDQSCQS